jgi:raffinose/stachyose/melibiose transport system substrate-binding protein
MSTAEEKPRTGIRRWVNGNTLGAAFLLTALVLSALKVLSIRQRLFDPDRATVRIAHWQLELGYRAAMDVVISNYLALHRDVNLEVLQMPVTEQVYPQWMNTHLISGTAPDLSERGMHKLSNEPEYVLRYYVPFGDIIDKPNPYNEGTPLEGVPWRDTFIDGMQGGYRDDLQDYYGAPVSFFNSRIFYNKKMLREAMGSDEPPQTLNELFEACEKIRAMGKIAIAGSRYMVQQQAFIYAYDVPFTACLAPELDTDMNGEVTALETYAAYQRGALQFTNVHVQSWFECVRAICDQFIKGFMGMDREQAAFLFVQGDACMIASGSWDAESLFKQSRFEVGVMPFPLPAPNDRWGKYIIGKRSEAATRGGNSFGLYKLSREKQWSLDFVKYLTSLKGNQVFNQKVNWLPIIAGASPTLEMMPFMPDVEGYSDKGGVEFRDDGRLEMLYDGQLYRYLQAEMTYDEFTAKLDELFSDRQHGIDRVWATACDNEMRGERTKERLIAMLAAAALLAPEQAVQTRDKVRKAILDQILGNGGRGTVYRYEQQNDTPFPFDLL